MEGKEIYILLMLALLCPRRPVRPVGDALLGGPGRPCLPNGNRSAAYSQHNVMLLNETSRFHVAVKAAEGGAKKNERVRLKMRKLVSELENDTVEARRYIVEKKAGT
jgi:hypothetical protein